MGPEVLTTAQMAEADRLAIAAGIPGRRLMEAAGFAVALEIRRRFRRVPVAILCGPGNNGGDGFVAARHLAADGWPVRLSLLGKPEALAGDAAWAAARWRGATRTLGPDSLEGCGLVIDALFGAGLARPLDGAARKAVEAINRSGLPCVAVDLPSGVNGDSGAVLGAAPRCVATVSFFRPKPAHFLYPARGLCGAVRIADIGIPASVLERIGPQSHVNRPGDAWSLPTPGADSHKYTRGHVVAFAGPVMTGAARLAAAAARRAGAGMVTVLAPQEAVAVLRGGHPGLIVAEADDDPTGFLERRKAAAAVIGPGGGDDLAPLVAAVLATGLPTVIDAGALTAFAGRQADLARLVAGRPVVATPHDGEMARLFGDRPEGDGRLGVARRAAERLGCVVVAKGPDSVIAAPDGRALVTPHQPHWLATAGSGDVLAGLIGGALAQGLEPLAAAGAGVWLQVAATRLVGPGLIAEDLIDALPRVLEGVFYEKSYSGGGP